MMRAPWMPGPAHAWPDRVIVSLTDFTLHQARDLPQVWRTGMRLRRSWPQMSGAVGVWLWSLPAERRSGSVSVWQTEEDLLRFVRWPVHMEIMRRHRTTGTLESTTWEADHFIAAQVWSTARGQLEPTA